MPIWHTVGCTRHLYLPDFFGRSTEVYSGLEAPGNVERTGRFALEER